MDIITKTKNRLKKIFHSPYFKTKNIKIGRNCHFGKNVVFNCDKVVIGDGVIIQDNVRFDCTELYIGDYATIYFGCFFPGPGKLTIGHNFWLGNNSIVDSQGGTIIKNNVGIGAHSQLWSHMVFGDTLYGCRFDSKKELEIGNDVWLVGHNLVSPVKIGDRVVALLGSLITKDIGSDRIIAGVPATDVTEKIGPPFIEKSNSEKKEELLRRIKLFAEINGCLDIIDLIKITDDKSPIVEKFDGLIFNVEKRTYTKKMLYFESDLIRYLLPCAKFIPEE